MYKRLTYLTTSLWESKFDIINSKRDKLQDLNINQLKLEVHETYKKEEKMTANFEAVNDEDVINKAFLDDKLLRKKRSFIKNRKSLQRV